MVERSYRFDDETYDLMCEVAQMNEITVSSLVRLAVKRFLEDYNGYDNLVKLITDQERPISM